ncbi:MAG TPA: hypothetical protein VGM30_03720 [Puia sp.]|jgi:hypothetical protein
MNSNAFLALALSLTFLDCASAPLPHSHTPLPKQTSAFASAGTSLTIFGRGLYPGDDSTFDDIRLSGFTTVVLSSFYIHENGDVYSGDSHSPIIHDGKYIGDMGWLRRIKSLKQKPGSVIRIEILLEGRWYNQPPNTFDFIRDWSDPARQIPGIVTGTGKTSTLYQIAKLFKKDLGVDAVCIDDESVYDSVSVLRFGAMLHHLKMHMSLCPFRNLRYWKALAEGSKKGLVDAIYLQCYDGGSRNIPGRWADSLAGDIPLYPIFLCRGAYNSCSPSHNSKNPDEIKAEMIKFRTTYSGMKGGAIWQMEDVKNYIRSNCAIRDPQSGPAVSEKEYLIQLKNSLQDGLSR